MRIAQLANYVGPTSGGMKTALHALAQGYVAAGVERMLVIPGPTDSVETTDLGRVVQVRSPRVGGGYRLIVEPWKVNQVLADFAPTSIEVSDKFTLMLVSRWARRQGIGTVLFSHERFYDYMLQLTGLHATTRMSAKLLYRMLVRSFDAVVVTSDFARTEFEPYAGPMGLPVAQVPLGVDLDRFRPQPRAHSDALRLIYVGRLSREKSPDLAVGTAVELHRRGVPIRLDVFGEGAMREELETLAADAPVVFHGHVANREHIAWRLAQSDVALSACPIETFGLAVLEALASGTPVVTADRGGARELVDEACGAWGAPDSTSLADAVMRLAARDQDFTRAAARARAEQFPWARTIADMLALHGGFADRSLTRGGGPASISALNSSSPTR